MLVGESWQTYMGEHCLFYPEAETIRRKDWKKVREFLQKEPRALIHLICTWSKCKRMMESVSFDQVKTEEPLIHPAPSAPISTNSLYPSLTCQIEDPGSTTMQVLLVPKAMEQLARNLSAGAQKPFLSPLQAMVDQEKQKGELSAMELAELQALCPVRIETGGQVAVYTMPYKLLAEIRKASTDTGLQSGFAMGTLQQLMESHTLIPRDWKSLEKQARSLKGGGMFL